MSDLTDRELGMHRNITRRDFLNGVAVTVGAALMPSRLFAAEGSDPEKAPGNYYPPALTGLRGSHDGSFETAHSLRDGTFWDTAGTPKDTGESFDLVIVGGCISGLSAAHFYRKTAGAHARILILDNHDDFGGHAKRNEFEYNGRLLALNGGTLNIESPLRYNAPAQEILRDVGIDLDRYLAANAKNRDQDEGVKTVIETLTAARVPSRVDFTLSNLNLRHLGHLPRRMRSVGCCEQVVSEAPSQRHRIGAWFCSSSIARARALPPDQFLSSLSGQR